MEKHRCICVGWNWPFEARRNNRKANFDAIRTSREEPAR